MQRLEVATHVFVDRATVFDFLTDFAAYAQYSDHLEEVACRGDGGAGTEYDLTVSWWRLSHTACSRVTGVDPPNRIDWQLVSGLTARGAWVIEAADPSDADAPQLDGDGSQTGEGEPRPDGNGSVSGGDPPVTRVRLVVEYDPESAEGLSTLLPTDAVVDRAVPVIRSEATDTVERVVADLEGEPRTVELEVRRGGE